MLTILQSIFIISGPSITRRPQLTDSHNQHVFIEYYGKVDNKTVAWHPLHNDAKFPGHRSVVPKVRREHMCSQTHHCGIIARLLSLRNESRALFAVTERN